MDYATSIAQRTAAALTGTAGAFRNGATTGASYSDFDQSYNPINSYEQGSAGSVYTVRKGDTLQGIAAGLYGDSALWYKIAEVNGLSGQTALIEGQSLTLPAGVIRNTNNASTFQPYDPAATIGDTSPTAAAAPPKKKGCGAVGAVFLAIIAIAVTVVTAGAAFTALGGVGSFAGAGVSAISIAAGAIGGAAGSIVSQAVGVATGIQEKFSWKAVALAAIDGGVGAGMGNSFDTLKGAAQAMARGAASSAITQGIGVVTGLQDKFSWAGVAAAGVGAGVGNLASGTKLAGAIGAKSSMAADIFISGADAIGNAATRSLIEGSNFGDNIIAALPDVIGGAIGRRIGGAVASRMTEAARVKAETANLKAAVNQTKREGIRTDFLDRVASTQTVQSKSVAALLNVPDSIVDTDGVGAELRQNLLLNSENGASLQLTQAAGVEIGLRRRELALLGQPVFELSDSHKRIIALSAGLEVNLGTKEWTTIDAAKYAVSGRVDGREALHKFKDQWVRGYREVIDAAAKEYNIPPLLLAGVAWNEVGGDPQWIDPIAYAARPDLEKDRTSFGPMSIQLRRVKDTLGYGGRALSPFVEASLLRSVQDPRQSIFFAAAHLRELMVYDFPRASASTMAPNQIAITATRYNRGLSETVGQISQNNSYGAAVLRRSNNTLSLLGIK